MAKIDLSNFRVVKSGNEDHDRNYINDILHAIVNKMDFLTGDRQGVESVGVDSTMRITNADAANPILSARPAIDSANAYTDAAIAALPTSTGSLIVPIYAGQMSAPVIFSNKRILGSFYFDPNKVSWGLKPTSTATLNVLLETTNSLSSANADLLRQPAAGSPAVVGTVTPITNTTATLTTANVSTYFRPGVAAATFQLRIWAGLSTEYTTCTGAWIEVIP